MTAAWNEDGGRAKRRKGAKEGRRGPGIRARPRVWEDADYEAVIPRIRPECKTKKEQSPNFSSSQTQEKKKRTNQRQL
ncbi:hypothetical protein WN51_11783 [Melipona quadrifasciata]|uniref:Uncharacterized protein n=1 Tax=Melipona quadrifasciata TaxID=166423 RepID=A0A0M9A3P8_9HYME|nr:hypothetical protein WN51_11783 [Melipona quadrifasciata]